MSRLISIFIIFTTLLILFSCNEKKGPEAALKSFIHYRFSSNQMRQEMLQRTTGPLHLRLAEMSDEEFSNFSNMDGYSLSKIKLSMSKCNDDQTQCYMTYLVKYSIKKQKEEAYAVEVKKIADMKVEDGDWRISNVNNIKTYFDSKNPIFP